MAELISFSEDECGSGSGDSDSGVAESYIAKCRDLSFDLATFDIDGNLTDIPWATVSSPYVHVVPTNDDSAYYNQKYDDVNDLVVQEGYFRISGINATNVAAADLYKDGCCFVAIHVLQNGKAIIQGVEKVFYEGEFHLVPSGGKTTAKSVNVNTNSGSLPARLDFVLSSYSEHFSLFIEDINPFLDIEPPAPPTAPTVSLSLVGTVLTATWDNGGDAGAVKSLKLVSGLSEHILPTAGAARDVREDLCGNFTVTTWDVVATITNSEDTDSDSIIGMIERTTAGFAFAGINGVDCYPPPVITINPPVSNILPLPTIDDGCGCGLSDVSYSIDLGLSTVTLTAGDFPYDLTDLCGGSVDYSWRTDLELTVSATNNDTIFATETAVVATVVLSGFGPYTITSVNGVSC